MTQSSAPSRQSHKAEFIEQGDDSTFLSTYADLVTLLLAFFVMLYGMSETDVGKFDGAAYSLRHALFGLNDSPSGPDPIVIARAEPAPDQIEKLINLLHQRLPKSGVQVQRDRNQVRIRIDATTLFKSGSADLTSEAQPTLQQVAQVISDQSEYNVRIEGHTDNVPISNARFPSNWELSAIRATTVLRLLIERGIPPTRVTATGYGSLLPLVPNTNKENRARNRRVELVLEKDT